MWLGVVSQSLHAGTINGGRVEGRKSISQSGWFYISFKLPYSDKHCDRKALKHEQQEERKKYIIEGQQSRCRRHQHHPLTRPYLESVGTRKGLFPLIICHHCFTSGCRPTFSLSTLFPLVFPIDSHYTSDTSVSVDSILQSGQKKPEQIFGRQYCETTTFTLFCHPSIPPMPSTLTYLCIVEGW